MKILAINADRGIAVDGTKGASVHLRSFLGAMAIAGCQVTLATRRMPDPEAVKHLPFAVVPLVDIDAAIDDIGPDLIFERYSLAHLAGLEAAHRNGLPLVLEVNAQLSLEAARHRPDTTSTDDSGIEARLWREADLVLPVSRALESRIVAVRGCARGVLLMPNGIDPELFAQLPDRAPRCEPPYRLGFLGHPKPWHGASLLPDLMSDLGERGIDAVLRIVGGGRGAEALRIAFEERDLGQRLEITGALPQREAIIALAESDIALAPYDDMEDFYFCPLKVLESMAAGLPLITHPLGDIPELTGTDAFLVPAGSASAIADAVQALLGEPALRVRAARAGRQRALDRHSWGARVACLLERVAGPGRASMAP